MIPAILVVSALLAAEGADEAVTSPGFHATVGRAETRIRFLADGATSIEGAPFFLHEPVPGKFNSPQELGTTTARIELFVDQPDADIARALAAGAKGSLNHIRDHEVPWGIHRQGGFTDPFGHAWLVGDKSPLKPFP